MGRNNGQPTYRLHKGTGQGVVTIDGRDYYLGTYGTKESKQRYDRMIAEWLLRGRQGPAASAETATVSQLVAGYLENVRMETSGEPLQYKLIIAMRWLNNLYGDTPAKDFNPGCLNAIRKQLELTKCKRFGREEPITLSRAYINQITRRIKIAFCWAAGATIIPTATWVALSTVKAVSIGRGGARENPPVEHVEQEDLDATLEVCNPTLKAMILTQLYTGMRCGEMLQMRACDIDMSKPVWKYIPRQHKTAALGKKRWVPISKRIQEIILPFITHEISKPLFQPETGQLDHVALFKSPDGSHHLRSYRVKSGTIKKCNQQYRPETYACMISNATKRADKLAHLKSPQTPKNVRIVKHWHSHQLRHNAAAVLTAEFGIGIAGMVLGHSSKVITGMYAGQSWSAVETAMKQQIG